MLNNMDTISLNIKDSIINTIKRENEELGSLHNKGVFFLPELTISYLVGKDLVKNAIEIFNSKIKNWYPEYTVGSRGPSDLYIELENNNKYVFEFKTRQTSESYISDIKKLIELDSSFEKYFCAFIDCFENIAPNDKRILNTENIIGESITRVSIDNSFNYFVTKDHARVKNVVCIVGLWKIK